MTATESVAHILIVEDDPVHQELTRRALEHAGVKTRVSIVEDGEEALDYLCQRGKYSNPRLAMNPDLVLLDINIPRSNGIEVLSYMHDNPPHFQMPAFVVLSNSKDNDDIVNAYRFGAKAYIAKPHDFDAFVEFINGVMKNILSEILMNKMNNIRMREQEQALRQLSRMALAEEMSASIAHQINQPLTAIMSYASGCMYLMKRQRVNPKLVEGMEKLISEVSRAGDIVRDLRRFLQSGELNREPCNLNEVLYNSIEYTRQYSIDALVQVETYMADPLPEVLGDPIHLEQVAINLITNAIDAMREDGDLISKLTLRTLSVNNKVMMVIEDTGPGVENPEKMFTPFYTVKPKGMGIGLSVAHRIVEAHEGEISLDTTFSGGARFVVSLPAFVENSRENPTDTVVYLSAMID